ncbi:gephyrin-like molybdotransferase Glp [Paracoccus sp. (in: a-proteobacteria)]|uniref:molybdopterin molybdotransferase MoeA n=1 Tax=Paracoccus sp. TaxID=267 RepID=UPI00396D0400
MITVDEALAHVLSLAQPPRPEVVPLAKAHGRALLEPAQARLTQPPFDASAMDGYAMHAADIAEPLTVIGTSAAGHPWTGTARQGTAVRIFTGAPVPAGYDHVELQENVRRDGDHITVETRSQGSNIRKRGNDFCEGDAFPAGRRLTASDVGLLAAMNLPQVTVARRPLVVILAGGDELLAPGSAPQPGQIISSNDLAVGTLAEEAGAEVRILPIARDTEDSLTERFAAARDADLLVTIGGASVGDHDLIGRVAADQGLERSFYKIRMRPGKPLLAGRLSAAAMLGLPGNPVSAITCGLLFMQPLIKAMLGLPPGLRQSRARLKHAIPAEGPRQHYLRAQLSPGPDLPLVAPFRDQDSAQLSLMSQADALLVRPADDPAREAGDIMDVILLRD